MEPHAVVNAGGELADRTDPAWIAALALGGVAALFISLGIIWDGFGNTKAAVVDLMDQQARRYDDKEVHPLAHDIVTFIRQQPWVADAGVRIRDMGQVFHVEAFVVPRHARIRIDDVGRLSDAGTALDWKIQDFVVIPSAELPDEADASRPNAPKG